MTTSERIGALTTAIRRMEDVLDVSDGGDVAVALDAAIRRARLARYMLIHPDVPIRVHARGAQSVPAPSGDT